MELSDLQNIHHGEAVYVFGSGASLNYLNPRFFDNQICVSTNFVGGIFGLRKYFTFSHYERDSWIVATEPGSIAVVCPRGPNMGTCGWDNGVPEGVIVFDTNKSPPAGNFNPLIDWPTDDSLVIGASSLHGSMHLAAHLGAATIVLVGADCGMLGGDDRVRGYPAGDVPWVLYERQLRLMKIKIKEVYGCDVYSMNPFVNYNLEGVRYVGANTIN